MGTDNSIPCTITQACAVLFPMLTIPARAAFSVRAKDQADLPHNPSLHMPNITMLAPLPPRTVLIMAREMIKRSPGFDIEPADPPLKARNPAISIIPPIPVSCGETHLYKESFCADNVVNTKIWHAVTDFALGWLSYNNCFVFRRRDHMCWLTFLVVWVSVPLEKCRYSTVRDPALRLPKEREPGLSNSHFSTFPELLRSQSWGPNHTSNQATNIYC